jgi:hypothetical protein
MGSLVRRVGAQREDGQQKGGEKTVHGNPGNMWGGDTIANKSTS